MVRVLPPSQPRFSDEMLINDWPVHAEPKPNSPHPASVRCPFCDQTLSARTTNIGSVFWTGFQRLFMAIVTILGAIVRTARLLVAAALCLVGLVGYSCRAIGMRIAHPHDRRFFAFPGSRRNAAGV